MALKEMTTTLCRQRLATGVRSVSVVGQRARGNHDLASPTPNQTVLREQDYNDLVADSSAARSPTAEIIGQYDPAAQAQARESQLPASR